MNPKELRIGNYAQDELSKAILEVVELKENDIVTSVIDRSMFPLKKGWKLGLIPLTEEWLLKLGFKYSEETECYHYYNLILNKQMVVMDIDTHVYLKSVHQLQNLYFAITSLEINCNNVVCPKCGEKENLHHNFTYDRSAINDYLCNECGTFFPVR